MRFLTAMTTIFALLGTAAAAQVGPSAKNAQPLRIALPVLDPDCGSAISSDGAIVVCGRRDRRYRIDPTVMAVSRRLESRGGPRPEGHTTLFKEGCGPVGSAPCAGQNVLPVSAIALTLATALIKAVKGEDLRPVLRTVPSEYDLYKQAKAMEVAQSPDTPK